MSKILVLIDGFNFYHRLKDYQYFHKRCVKWLNYAKLIKNCFNDYDMHEFEYIYFSAKAKFRGDDAVERHNIYIEALKTEGIKIVLGKFKEKEISRCGCDERCVGCNSKQDKTPLIKHEEKNTDVNIAITLVEKAIKREYDKCYILSSDSDFNSAIKRAKELYPEGAIVLCPPPQPNNRNRKCRYNIADLKKITKSNPLFFSWEKIEKSQFPDVMGNLVNPWKK